MIQRIPTFENFQYNDDTKLYELSENSTLYHRSMHKFEVGDIISPQTNKDGIHWLQNDLKEIALEEFRKKNYPNRPSRFNCVYSSVIPRSRFTDKGFLYVVKPIGELFMTDSMLIDKIGDEYYRNQNNSSYGFDITLADAKANPSITEEFLPYYEAQRYWKGTLSLPKARWGDLEVLSSSAQVVQVIEDASYVLRPGMSVTVTEDDTIGVHMTIYSDTRKHNKEAKELLPEELNKMIAYLETYVLNGKLTPKSYDASVYEYVGFLRKGAKLQVTFVRTNNAKNAYTGEDDKPEGRYNTIMFDFYMNKDLIKRSDGSPEFRLETYKYNTKVYDVGKYLQK